jgi:AcrR family transcriptional regulator
VAEPVGRTASKRRAIVEAATVAFLRSGYRGASMDEIAAAAGVSKQTVYKHFADKERLFSEVVRARVDEASTPVGEGVRGLRESGSLEADLRELARRQLDLVMQPRILQLRRLVIREAARFPELGRTFYEQGLERTVEALSSTFEALAARRLLVVPDPKLAATHFNWLIMSGPMNRAMLLGLDVAPPDDELDQWVDEGVRTFLAAYGAH